MSYAPCNTISKTLGELFTCSEVRNGYTRIRTPYLYPDGDVLDLFYKVSQRGPIITDVGETSRWLLSQTSNEFLSKKQDRAIQDILLTHDVSQYRGALVVELGSSEDITDATVRLAQAAMSMSNLYYLYRTRMTSSFDEEVADLLREKDISFEAGKKLKGKSGRDWRIDFQTSFSKKISLVQALSTGSRAAANTKANNVVAAWVDLSRLEGRTKNFKFVSLLDDTADIWREETINQISEFSKVVYWSESEKFVEILKIPVSADL